MATPLLTARRPPSIQIPHSTPAETVARVTFTQLMWALSYPGRRFRLHTPHKHGWHLPGQSAAPIKMTSMAATFSSCLTVGNTLLDLETSFFTPDTQLAHALARTGARSVTAADAAYHFYPDLTTVQHATEMLAHAQQAQVGTLLYPDQAATLIVGCKLGIGSAMRLRGPGIASESALSVGGIPPAFWQLRAERVIYPIGWDLFLLDGDQVVGLPRTTLIEHDRVDLDRVEHDRVDPNHSEGEA